MAEEAQIFVECGEIQLGRGLRILPRHAESALLGVLATPPQPLVHNGPYRSYARAEVEIASRAFIPALWFRDGRLWQATLSAVDPSAKG